MRGYTRKGSGRLSSKTRKYPANNIHSDIIAVGALIFCTRTNRALFMLRDQDTYSGCWGLVGGRADPGETALQALYREAGEETGYKVKFDKIIPLELYQSNDQHFTYHTFICMVEQEFTPVLCAEHSGYAWAPLTNAPRPLHPGLYNSLNSDIIQKKVAAVTASLDY